MPAALRRDFDHVIANPPWYPPGGTPSPVAVRATAMQVVPLPLASGSQAAARRLAPGGWLTLIAGPMGAGAAGGWAQARARPRSCRWPPARRAAGAAGDPARAQGRAAPFRLLAPLVLHQGAAHDGDREAIRPRPSAVLRVARR
jgi:tRNA1Val (adenine37-N6)-methyltransferase